jgi:hypothetical protein
LFIVSSLFHGRGEELSHASVRLRITQPSITITEKTISAELFVCRVHVRLTKAGITPNVVQEASVIQTQVSLADQGLALRLFLREFAVFWFQVWFIMISALKIQELQLHFFGGKIEHHLW